jgi:hypothetical protein
MDRSVPVGFGKSVGLDGILGLVPGLGDVAGALISTALIVWAWRAGVRKVSVFRMAGNILVDTVIGSVPVLGDLFDFAYKTNTRNFAIIRESLAGQRDTRQDWIFLALVGLALFAAIAIPLLLLALVLHYAPPIGTGGLL